jgi:hypothetical protein
MKTNAIQSCPLSRSYWKRFFLRLFTNSEFPVA